MSVSDDVTLPYGASEAELAAITSSVQVSPRAFSGWSPLSWE